MPLDIHDLVCPSRLVLMPGTLSRHSGAVRACQTNVTTMLHGHQSTSAVSESFRNINSQTKASVMGNDCRIRMHGY